MRGSGPSRHASVHQAFLLAELAELEQALWRHGGVSVLRRRRAAVEAAWRAGCGVVAIAQTLGVTPADVRAWLTGPAPEPV